MPSSNYNATIEYLFSLRTTGTKLGLESIRYLLDKLDSPDKLCDYIHVAGTNGKGSTSAMIAAILQSSGLKVGLFTSPHLIDFRERFTVNSIQISKDEITSYLKKINLVVESMDEISTPRKPTFFEIVTAIGVLHFANKKCDVVILETGMGGRLDATNAVKSCASVITKISLDHTKWLGDNIEKIAAEKAGIIKQGSPVFTSNIDPTPLRIIKTGSTDKKCRLTCIIPQGNLRSVKNDINYISYYASHVNNGHYNLDIDSLPLKASFINLQGLHQAENAALAAVVSNWYLKKQKISNSVEFIKSGLKNVCWPGRCQIISENPFTLIDCAHNPDGIKNLVKTLKEMSSNKWIVVLGILNDKHPERIINYFSDIASEILYVKPNSERGLTFDKFSDIFSNQGISGVKLKSLADVSEIKRIIQNNKYSDKKNIVVTGSCYLIGDLLSTLNLNVRDNRTDDPLNI